MCLPYQLERTPQLCTYWYDLVKGGGLAPLILTTLQRHNTENSKQILPEKELHGHRPNSYIHVSASDLYIPRIGLPILLQENRWTDLGNI
jgi:hypothetical protein